MRTAIRGATEGRRLTLPCQKVSAKPLNMTNELIASRSMLPISFTVRSRLGPMLLHHSPHASRGESPLNTLSAGTTEGRPGELSAASSSTRLSSASAPTAGRRSVDSSSVPATTLAVSTTYRCCAVEAETVLPGGTIM